MGQIKHQIHQAIEPFTPHRPEKFPIIEAPNGKQIAMVPLEHYKSLNSHDFAYRVVAVGIALGAIAAGAAMFIPAVTPEPVVIREQLPPQIVDRNCIAFCGK